MNSASQLQMRVQDSPTNKIDSALKTSVQRMIRQEQSKITNVIHEGVVVTTELSPLKKLSDALWFSTAVKQHKAAVKAGQRGCVDCFKVYCIGDVFVAEQRGVTLVFANIYNMLTQFRSIGSDYNVTLQGDVTHNWQGVLSRAQQIGIRHKLQVVTSLRWCTRSFQLKARASIRMLPSGRLSTLRQGPPCDCLHATAQIGL